MLVNESRQKFSGKLQERKQVLISISLLKITLSYGTDDVCDHPQPRCAPRLISGASHQRTAHDPQLHQTVHNFPPGEFPGHSHLNLNICESTELFVLGASPTPLTLPLGQVVTQPSINTFNSKTMGHQKLGRQFITY